MHLIPTMALGTGLALASPMQAESLERTLPVAPGGRLRIELDLGAVDVESHDEAEVEIDADGAGFGVDFDLRQSGDEVRLSGTFGGSFWNFLRGGGQVRVRARVPRDFSVHVETRGGRVSVEEIRGEVEAHTTGGSIDVDRVEGAVHLRTTGGSVDATQIVGDLRAETTGGSIRIEDVQGGVEARTTGGGIRVEEVSGRVEAHTTGGPVRVSWDAAPDGFLRTTGGGIEVEIPEGSGAELRAQATGGRISIDDDLAFSGAHDRSGASGRLASGGSSLDLQTTGGGIRIRRR